MDRCQNNKESYMKIIHCADIHLGSGISYIEDPAKRRERQDELLETYRRMFRYAVLNEIEAIIIAGDLFDTDQVAAPLMGAVIREIIDHPDISVYYLKGNHDVNIKSGIENIPNLHCFTDVVKVYDLHNNALPKMNDIHDLHGDTDVVRSLHNSNAIRNDRVNVNIAGVELTPDNRDSFYDELNFAPEDFNILVLHGQLYENGGSNELAINKRLLQHRNIDYLALGHIHAYRSGGIDARGIYCYPGCLEGRGFDECGSHGFVVLDIDTADGNCKRSFVEFARRKLHEIQVDITDMTGGAEILNSVEKSLDNARCPEQDMIGVELTGMVDQGLSPVCAYIKKVLSERYYYIKVKDATKKTYSLHNNANCNEKIRGLHNDVNYNEKIYGLHKNKQMDDKSGRYDRVSFRKMFTDTVRRKNDISEADREEIIRLGIMALNGEELI